MRSITSVLPLSQFQSIRFCQRWIWQVHPKYHWTLFLIYFSGGPGCSIGLSWVNLWFLATDPNLSRKVWVLKYHKPFCPCQYSSQIFYGSYRTYGWNTCWCFQFLSILASICSGEYLDLNYDSASLNIALGISRGWICFELMGQFEMCFPWVLPIILRVQSFHQWGWVTISLPNINLYSIFCHRS